MMKPVSKTAYYCCGVRMADAESENPLIGDKYARKLLGEEGLKYWQEFEGLGNVNISNTVRHYIIDQELDGELRIHPRATVILIGAGLDTRAYRFGLGRWVEIDELSMIEYKNGLLPAAECPNPLDRIAIDFEKNELADKLAPYSGATQVFFVIEGVWMYLNSAARENMLNTLIRLFPKHLLLCDLMKKSFFEKYSREIHEKLVARGTSFADMEETPAHSIIQKGYRQEAFHSIILTSIELERIAAPKLLMRLFFKKALNGYGIYKFVYGEP